MRYLKYIGLRLSSSEEMNALEKRKYIDSLYDKRNEVGNGYKIGFINKFSNAMGYKYLTYEHEDYDCNPYNVLFDKIYAYPFGNTIFDIYVENKDTISNQGKVLYNNKEMVIKLSRFLKKVFPNLDVSLFEHDKLPGRKIWLESFSFISIENHRITIETSLSEELTVDEIHAVKKVVSLFKDYDLKFKGLCFRCESCIKNNPSKPFHFSIENDYTNESYKKSSFLYNNDLDYKPKCFYCATDLSEKELIKDQDTCKSCYKKIKKKELFSVN